MFWFGRIFWIFFSEVVGGEMFKASESNLYWILIWGRGLWKLFHKSTANLGTHSVSELDKVVFLSLLLLFLPPLSCIYVSLKIWKKPACNSILYSLFLQLDVQSVLPVSWEDNQAACLLPGCSELLQPAKKTLWDFVQNSKKLNIYLPSYNLCSMGLIWKVPRLKGQVSFQTVFHNDISLHFTMSCFLENETSQQWCT